MRNLILLFLLVSNLAMAEAVADNAAVIADLRAHRFDDIERRLESIDQSFQKRLISELDLLDAYKAFYEREDMLSDDLKAWEDQHPNSYIAHLASGTHLRKLGEFRRGEGYIQNVPPDVRRYMDRQFTLAQQELWRALELNPKSFLSMLNLMDVAQFEGNDAMADKLLAMGAKAYPGNLLLRARYLVHLTPRWGGSKAAMDAFIASSRAGRPSDFTNLLEAIQCEDQGITDWVAGHHDRALLDFRRSMILARGADTRFVKSYLANSAAHCEATADGKDVACR